MKKGGQRAGLTLFALALFHEIIDFPAYFIGHAAKAGGGSRFKFTFGDFFLQNFFDFFPYFIEHNVVNHYCLSFE